MYTFPFPFLLVFPCLPPQPLTLCTPDLQINHVIKSCKVEGKRWIYCFCWFDSYLISPVCHFSIPRSLLLSMRWSPLFKQQLFSFFFFFPSGQILTNWIFNCCLLILSYYTVSFKILYIIHMKDLNMERSQLTYMSILQSYFVDPSTLWTCERNIISVIVHLVNCTFLSTIDNTKQMEVPWLGFVELFLFFSFLFFLPKWGTS